MLLTVCYDHLLPTLLPWAGTPSTKTRLLKAPSNLALNTARDGAATASLSNLCQCLTTLTGKNFFLKSHLNLPSVRLKPFPLVLSLPALVKSPSPHFLSAHLGMERLLTWKMVNRKIFKMFPDICKSPFHIWKSGAHFPGDWGLHKNSQLGSCPLPTLRLP